MQLLYDASWEPHYKELMDMMKRPVTEKRKARLLLRYDPFKSTWTTESHDLANADAEFDTQHVPRRVGELERQGAR